MHGQSPQDILEKNLTRLMGRSSAPCESSWIISHEILTVLVPACHVRRILFTSFGMGGISSKNLGLFNSGITSPSSMMEISIETPEKIDWDGGN